MRIEAILPSTAFALILATAACTVLPLYFPAFVSRSPDGQSEVRVTRNFPGSEAEYRFRVEVRTGQTDRVIYENNQGSMLGLFEINWSQDGKKMGLLACNWGRPLLLGYDISQERQIDGAAFQGLIEAQLRRKYSLSGRDDAFYWACTAGASAYRRTNGQ